VFSSGAAHRFRPDEGDAPRRPGGPQHPAGRTLFSARLRRPTRRSAVAGPTNG